MFAEEKRQVRVMLMSFIVRIRTQKAKQIPGLFQDWLKQIPGPKI